MVPASRSRPPLSSGRRVDRSRLRDRVMGTRGGRRQGLSACVRDGQRLTLGAPVFAGFPARLPVDAS